jgi:hypothetical protein
MQNHPWPLKNRIPDAFEFFTKAELIEFLDEVPDDTPIWIDNYWQIRHQITQRPVELLYADPDGFHIG